MPEDRQKLTDKSLQEFVSKVHKEPELKKRILEKLATPKDVITVVNEFFVLDDKQNQNLRDSIGIEKFLHSAVMDALTTGGKIRLTPDFTRIQPVSAGVHVGVHNGPNGTDVDVSITCPV